MNGFSRNEKDTCVASRNSERRYSRVHLPVSAQLSCEELDCFQLPAHLRDVSAGGAFFYADLDLKPGAVVRIDFSVPAVGSQVQIACEGTVVRVEQRALGDRSGIAIQFVTLQLS